MSKSELVKKAYRYRKSNVTHENYRKYYKEYCQHEELEPWAFHAKVSGNPEFATINGSPGNDTLSAARVYSNNYEAETIGKVRAMARSYKGEENVKDD